MQLLRIILTDARFGLRLLRRAPAFGATLLGVLILGIGATTAMFSLVSSLLLRPLPYSHPEELTMAWGKQTQVPFSPLSVPDFLDWREQGTTFAKMAAVGYTSFSLSSGDDKPEAFAGANVSGDFFPMFQIAPLHGRFFGVEDDRVGGPKVAVISAVAWRRRFGSDPRVVGRVVTLNSEPYTIIGVAPEGFRYSGPFSDHCDVWTPLAVTDDDYPKPDTRGNHYLHVMGRRKPGVSLAQAQAQLEGIAKTNSEKYPETNAHYGVDLRDLHEAILGSTRDSVLILFAAVALVFVVVCANVANLLLARAATRRGEMAARMALGATRRRLVGQLLTETVALFVVAALGGALLARALVTYIAEGFVFRATSTLGVRVDATALAFAIGTSLVFGVVFGLVPALEAQRVDPQTVLKESGMRVSMGRSARIFRAGLVVAQVAVAFALLAGSGLLLRAFEKLASTPAGFDGTGVVSAHIGLPVKYDNDAKMWAFWRDVLAKTAAQPGVTSVGANSSLPFASFTSNGMFQIEGRDPWPNGMGPLMFRNVIAPGYFRTMGIPLLRGRELTDADIDGSRLVVVVSQSVAEKFFPGEDPIGHRINLGDDDHGKLVFREIVGVVGDVRRWSLDNAPYYEAYQPLAQRAIPWLTIVARTSHPEALLKEMPGIVASVDSSQAIADLALMDRRVAGSLAPRRFMMRLLAAFAAAALLLATLGIFGVVSYTTTQRTRELGIRLALGSTPEGVVKLVMRDGVRLLGVGLGAGLVAALLIGRGAAATLWGAAPFDAVVFAVVLATLSLTGVVASLLPAIRAVRIAPSIALRYE